MKITLEPTPELFTAPINGVMVPTRVWRGTTPGGVPVEAYVLAIVPNAPDMDAAYAALKQELPPFMRPSHELYTVDVPDGGE